MGCLPFIPLLDVAFLDEPLEKRTDGVVALPELGVEPAQMDLDLSDPEGTPSGEKGEDSKLRRR